MNLKDRKYADFALVQGMMDTVNTVAKFNPDCSKEVAGLAGKAGKLYFTGEGSSRKEPALLTPPPIAIISGSRKLIRLAMACARQEV